MSKLNEWLNKFNNKKVKQEVVSGTPPAQVIDLQKNRIKQQVFRVEQEIGRWRSAVKFAESQTFPNRFQLYQVYQDIVLDPHLSAVRSNIMNKCLGMDFQIVDEEGAEDIEKTKFLKNSSWFNEFRKITLDTKDYGHSVVQFHEIDPKTGNFSEIELIPRVNIKPELNIYVNQWTEFTGTDYTDEPYSNWIIEIGERTDLGLLMKASPWVIWKINNAIFQGIYNEKYGTPIILAQTDDINSKQADNLQHMLDNIGNSSNVMAALTDKLSFIQPATGSGENYSAFSNFCDQQISKLYLGNTGETDMAGGGSYAQAKVHATVSEETALSRLKFIETVVNSKLIPFLNLHGMNWEGFSFKHDYDESLSTLDQFTMFKDIVTAGYDIDPVQFEERFGFSITKAVVPDNSMVKNPLKDSVLNFLKPQ
jgi:hypothetical protein